MSFIKLTDLDLSGKRVLIRADLNVPVKDGKVTSDARITASMPTIEHCMKAGAKVMVISHRGRPKKARWTRKTPCSRSPMTCRPSWANRCGWSRTTWAEPRTSARVR